MKTYALLLLATFLFSGLAAGEGSACTTFVLGEKNNQVFGRNYDWDDDLILPSYKPNGDTNEGFFKARPVV
jgi:penicillin V acylase-like amidase (Ntn superfamily)